jgi:pSer/pThr/pTyr-binding forkhead associated (FHA) protein
MSNAVKVFKHFESPKKAGEYFRLVCLTGKTKGVAYFLVGKRVVLGRSEQADIKVLDIKSSREHCEIAKVGKDFILTDLGSQNGVVVNDLKVRQHVLNEGDKVIIGQTVYKFNRVEVKEKLSEVQPVDDSDEYEDDEYDDLDEPKKSKLTPVLITIILIAVGIILTGGEDASTVGKKSKASRYQIQEVSGSIAESISKKSKKNKKVQDKMNIYFQKGLREFREDNYFRAMSEFEHALSWSPSDPQALFYLRKTKEALDKTIKDLILKGQRDEDAYKLQSAVVSYCSVLRLLYRYPEDERYLSAKENVEKLEEKLGLEKGDIECQKEIK